MTLDMNLPAPPAATGSAAEAARASALVGHQGVAGAGACRSRPCTPQNHAGHDFHVLLQLAGRPAFEALQHAGSPLGIVRAAASPKAAASAAAKPVAALATRPVATQAAVARASIGRYALVARAATTARTATALRCRHLL